MKTVFRICSCSVGWYQNDAINYAHTITKTKHRTVGAAVRALEVIQARCEQENGQCTYYDYKILAEENEELRLLNVEETDEEYEAELRQ